MGYEVEWPDAEYHEILPRLFLGGHLWAERALTKDSRHSSVSTDPSWDYVVSAYASKAPASWPQCDQRLVLFEDTEDGLGDETWGRIRSVVDQIVLRWRQGQKVLVRCQAGYNRSGMIMSLVLMRLGMTADKAIHQARWRRGRDVLVNRVFEGYVRAREDEYHDEEAWPSTEALMNAPDPTRVDEESI